MMPKLLQRDIIFFPIIMVIWIAAMFALHGDYPYLKAPFPSIDLKQIINQSIRRKQIVQSSLDELRKALVTEKDPLQKMHIKHNIGIAYYDMHHLTNQRANLDSARMFFEKSIEGKPKIARFYYNLGRTHTTLGSHPQAKKYYENALRIKPNHILALHNLGLLTYFELKQLNLAQAYLRKLITIDSRLPICNFVLGEIAVDNGEFKQALHHFEAEIRNFRELTRKSFNLPIGRRNMQYAAATSYLRLAVLYSTRFKNEKRAKASFYTYMKLETDPRRKNAAIQRMKKYWVIK